MRGGICTVQQALTPEAATTVKQAVALAKRRGHAQVTPLHVASSMLATSAGLLRRACLQCHSHPLQCKALELCFNVALNRLPASGPGPLLAPHPHRYPGPSFSNALVAAFKRAQAHQRRGSAENQQQPILALKIELEQLVISILDDPSVSRVMREAGFSSPHVKSRVEHALSLDPPANSKPHFPSPNPNPRPLLRHDDVSSVLTLMLTKKNNTVIVGESLPAAESVARGVIEAVDRSTGQGVMRYMQFVNLPLFSLRNVSREEAELKLVELRCVVKSYAGRGVVFYLGDLSWVSEFWSTRGGTSGYFALEQIMMELKTLLSDNREYNRVWLMGISTFQAYSKCKTGNPSLETLWELHPLTIPVGSSLSLSLKFESDVEGDVGSTTNKASKEIVVGDEKHCSLDVHNANSTAISGLPSWLQKYRDENIMRNTTNSHHQEYCITVGDLCKKWNSFCSPGQKHPHFADKPLMDSDNFNHALPNKQSPKEYQFWALESNSDNHSDQERDNLIVCDDDDEPAKPELLSNPNSSPNSASSSEVLVEDEDDNEDNDGELGPRNFNELNPENLRLLCDEMEKDVPWQKEIVPEIATTVLQCRSKRDQTCCLGFLGQDSRGKEKLARTLANIVFGSHTNSFVSIGLSSYLSSEESGPKRQKRTRDDSGSGSGYVQRFREAMNENPRRVFFLEDMEEVDECSQKGIKRSIKDGKLTLPCGETVLLKDSIVIICCDGFAASSGSRASSPKRPSSTSQKEQVSLDLNIAVRHDEDHGDEGEDSDSAYVGILESVDRKFVFKV